MKKLLLLLLITAILLSFSACFKKAAEAPTTAAPTTTVPTTQAVPAEPIFNYTAIEDILDKYVYDYIGGHMPFTALDGKLYFADHQYNTGCVNYYDSATGSVKNLAVDNANPLSGGPLVNSHSIVVSSYPAGSDPLEVEESEKSVHVYDLEKGELFISSVKFDFTVVAFQHGKVYGNDEKGNVCICNADGSAKQTLSWEPMMHLEAVYEKDGETYACLINYASSAINSRKLVRLSGGAYETLADIATVPFFDGELFYYTKAVDDGQQTAIKSYDVKTDTSKELLMRKGVVGTLYFVFGDRLYFPENLDDYHIRIWSHDLISGEETVISTGSPALGGW